MSKEPTKGEMQKCLDGWFERYCDDIDDANLERHKQICQAIHRLIENQPIVIKVQRCPVCLGAGKLLDRRLEDNSVVNQYEKPCQGCEGKGWIIPKIESQPEVDEFFCETWRRTFDQLAHSLKGLEISDIEKMLKEIPVRIKED